MNKLSSLFSRLRSYSAWAWYVLLVGAAVAIFWVCTFKIMDRDFWWHITAGEILLKTHTMITTDPFAYTRTDLPYLATHEWLAQMFLYLIYNTGGYVGIILFRGVIACTSVGLLLLLAQKKRFEYVALAVWGIVITKGSFLERPQLFTFVIFAAFLFLAFRFLDAESWRKRLWICGAFIGLELLWVNMHGGAALMGCAIVTFILLQMALRALSAYRRQEHLRIAYLLIGTLVCMGIALILPPNGFSTFTYLTQLLNDKTIAFIAEWQPRAWPLYIFELWPFFVLSISALIIGRKHWLFNGLLLLMTAYLSRQAFRHEILFVFAALATCFYQCDRSEYAQAIRARIVRRSVLTPIVVLIIVVFLAQTAYARSFGFERQDNLFGFGQFDLAKGAVDFLEAQHITGNMFNTYGIGGYLIHRGYPDRKVFIDGRNVDYGFDFMAHAYAAGIDKAQWDTLVDHYGISYAIVDYDAIKQDGKLPYSTILDTHPDWAMVYLDDWVAVYLRKTPENSPVIQRLQYKSVTASKLQFESDFSATNGAELKILISELQRMQNDNPLGIKATLSLAKIALREHRNADVHALVQSARAVRPYDPEPFALLAAVSLDEQKWEEAAESYDQLLRLAGDNYPDINYAFIASVFEKAGHPVKAWYYRLGLPMSAPVQDKTKVPAKEKPSLSVNPAADAQEFNAKALAQAEAGNLAEAKELFLTALKINPGAAEIWNNLCALQLFQKENTEAMESCKHAIEIDKEYGDAHYNLALALYRTKSYAEAKKEALLAQKWGPKKESEALLLLLKKQTP